MKEQIELSAGECSVVLEDIEHLIRKYVEKNASVKDKDKAKTKTGKSVKGKSERKTERKKRRRIICIDDSDSESEQNKPTTIMDKRPVDTGPVPESMIKLQPELQPIPESQVEPASPQEQPRNSIYDGMSPIPISSSDGEVDNNNVNNSNIEKVFYLSSDSDE